MIPLFNSLKDRLIQDKTFSTKAEASCCYYLIVFTNQGYEAIEFRKGLSQQDGNVERLVKYGILLEPLFKLRETHQLSKNPLIRRTSIVNVTVEPTGYTVKPEKALIAIELQKLIDDLFALSTHPEGYLVRARKSSSCHQ